MFDRNHFKKAVKEWIRLHPNANLNDLVDYCEELIPPSQYSANSWLIDQTVNWYKHLLSQSDVVEDYNDDDDYDQVMN